MQKSKSFMLWKYTAPNGYTVTCKKVPVDKSYYQREADYIVDNGHHSVVVLSETAARHSFLVFCSEWEGM